VILIPSPTRLILLVCVTLLPGCMLGTGAAGLFSRDKPEYLTPRQMVPVWSDTVLHQSGEPATRGVGGRIMFYGLDKHKAVRSEGTLVVYAWDDSQGMQERSPDRKFVFPAEDLQQHYSQSRLGHSYSFWLPWDAAGGQLTHLTLITRFVSKDGAELTSAPAHVVLPGPGDGVPFYQSLAKSRRLRGNDADELRDTGGESDQVAVDEVADGPVTPLSRNLRRGRVLGPRAPQRDPLEISVSPEFLARHAGVTSAAIAVDDQPRLPGMLQAPPPQAGYGQGSAEDSGGGVTGGVTGGVRAIRDREVLRAAYERVEEPVDQLSEDSELTESRVPASAAVRSFGDPRRKAPLRGQWPTALPTTPRQTFRRTADSH
jgi:hypothetical protein